MTARRSLLVSSAAAVAASTLTLPAPQLLWFRPSLDPAAGHQRVDCPPCQWTTRLTLTLSLLASLSRTLPPCVRPHAAAPALAAPALTLTTLLIPAAHSALAVQHHPARPSLMPPLHCSFIPPCLLDPAIGHRGAQWPLAGGEGHSLEHRHTGCGRRVGSWEGRFRGVRYG